MRLYVFMYMFPYFLTHVITDRQTPLSEHESNIGQLFPYYY